MSAVATVNQMSSKATSTDRELHYKDLAFILLKPNICFIPDLLNVFVANMAFIIINGLLALVFYDQLYKKNLTSTLKAQVCIVYRWTMFIFFKFSNGWEWPLEQKQSCVLYRIIVGQAFPQSQMDSTLACT